MSVIFSEPRPLLVINDETGEFVMTRHITAVRARLRDDGSFWFSAVYLQGMSECTSSPLTPRQLRNRMFDTSYPT